MGKFKDGHPKYGGRPPKGANKITREVRQALSHIVQGEEKEFIRRWHTLSDRDYCEIYVKLLPFIIPKLAAFKADITSDGTALKVQVIRLADGTEITM